VNVVSKNGDYTAQVNENAAKKGIQVKTGLSSVKLTPSGGDFNLKSVSDSAVRYTDVYSGRDYQFVSKDGTVQTKIIYTKTGKTNSFSFDLDKSLWLSQAEKDGGLVFSALGSELISLNAPVIHDASGATGEVSLSFKDGKITVTADKEWAKSLERAYPLEITFDLGKFDREVKTAIETDRPLASASDFTIEPSVSYDDDMGTLTVSTITISGNWDTGAQLSFSPLVAGFPDTITADETIPANRFDAGVEYTVLIDGEALSDTFLIYQLNGLLARGLSAIAAVYGNAVYNDNPLPNGVRLIAPPSSIFVRNPTTDGNVELGTPTTEELDAIVAWLLGKGITDINEYGLEPINYNTGNFLFEATDVEFPDYNGSFTIDRTFNSIGAKIKSSLGYGWSFKYDISLR
jgi:hypothetical protein